MPNEIPKKIRKQVKERADGYCEWCGQKAQILEIHHIIKRRKGIHRPETLIVLCGPVTFKGTCHYRAENKDFGHRLKLALQQHYRLKGYSEEEVRRLMGGKIYKR